MKWFAGNMSSLTKDADITVGGDNDLDARIKLYEYSALKSEQAARIRLRETALYLNIVVTISIFAAYFQAVSSKHSILLCIPNVSFVLFWIYRSNDAVITNIRKYIRAELDLGRQLSMGDKKGSDWFGWERYHRQLTVGRVVGKVVNLFVGSLSFLGPGILALVIVAGGNEVGLESLAAVASYPSSGPSDIGMFWWVGSLEIAIMAIWMGLTIDLRG